MDENINDFNFKDKTNKSETELGFICFMEFYILIPKIKIIKINELCRFGKTNIKINNEKKQKYNYT